MLIELTDLSGMPAALRRRVWMNETTQMITKMVQMPDIAPMTLKP